MIAFSNFHLALNGSAWIYSLDALLLIGFSFFIYRYTLPQIPTLTKILLTTIRSLIFISVLLLIYEPLLTLISSTTNKKNVFVFIDNSSSLASKDSLKRIDQIKNFVSEIKSIPNLPTKYFSFGNSIDSLPNETQKTIFDKPQTNFEKLDKFIEKREGEIKSVIILSDGIITDGVDPSYQLAKLSSPVFTIGIGDTTSQRDIQINDVRHNQFIYANKETKIETTILNSGFGNKTIQANLFEENKLIDSKTVTLNSSGMNKIQFVYKPEISGERKLRVEISNLDGDQNKNNNSKTFFVDVLNSKVKIALIAGSPSADVSALSNAIESDKNFQLLKVIEVAKDKDWSSKQSFSLDSAKILFLIDFPCKNMSAQLFEQVIKLIENGRPFFISVSNATDFSKLKRIEKYLPVSFSVPSTESLLIQSEINGQQYSSNFSQIGNSSSIWSNLPPINQLAEETLVKPESKKIVLTKMREMILNNPLITLRSVANQRSFLLNGWNYWRWALQTSDKAPGFFNNFIREIVKWLNFSADKKQFTITTNKKIFSTGESVEFTAELYDKSFNPIDTAHIELKINQEQNVFNISLSPADNGIYTGSFTTELKGDFQFSGKTTLNNEIITSNIGRFGVSNISIEKLDTKMRIDYLKQIAFSTNGVYCSIDNYNLLKQKLIDLTKQKESSIEHKKEYELWNNYFLLFGIIILFAAEWFSRKRIGMI